MEKKRTARLKKIIKKIKSEVPKDTLSVVEIHTVEPSLVGKIKAEKIKVKAKKSKKPKGEMSDGKTKDIGEKVEERIAELPGGNGKAGDKKRGAWWPWDF